MTEQKTEKVGVPNALAQGALAMPMGTIWDWRERVGETLLTGLTCSHDGEAFGDRAVCQTCFENVQRIGALMESEAARAWDRGTQATRIEDGVVVVREPNPYCFPPEGSQP